jgi:hypothetical protein
VVKGKVQLLAFTEGLLAGLLLQVTPTPYTLHRAPCTLHPTPCTLHPTPYTLHPAPYTLHPAPCILHPVPYTLHPSPYTLHPGRRACSLASCSRSLPSTVTIHSYRGTSLIRTCPPP